MNEDRRRHPRVSLDAPFFCDVTPEGGRTFVTIVRDICPAGLRLDLPPEGCRPRPGDVLRLSDCAECAKGVLDGLTAEVAWVSGDQCGLRLVRPEALSPRVLRRILDDCGM